MSDENDKGVRKFRGMIFTQFLIWTGALLFAWRGWSDSILEIMVWGVSCSFVGFAVPNVVEKIIQRFPGKQPKVKP